MSGYEVELARARRDIGALEVMIGRNERALELRVRLAYRQFHLASLTEDEVEFERLGKLITTLIDDFGPLEDVSL